ncbi:PTS sugar transporter subunit IIC [Lacticaseibacillus pabuli]
MTKTVQAKDKADADMKFGDWVSLVSQGIGNTILVILGMGLLLNMLGTTFHWEALAQVGTMAQKLLAPALGVTIAMMLRCTTLVTGATMIAATVGSNAVFFSAAPIAHAATATGWQGAQTAGSVILTSGQPVSAVLAGVFAAVLGKWLTGRTPLDMVLVPFAVSFLGSLVGLAMASVTTPALNWVSERLAATMQVSPVIGAALVSAAWFLFLMTPASSAALAVAVQLDPMSAGAALIGTTVAFVAFTAMSYNQNTIGANIAQTLVTPKIQFSNLLKNPLLAAGPLVVAAGCAVVAVVFFNFKVPYAIAGLGLNSLIAPLWLAPNNPKGLVVLVIFGVVVPVVLSWIFYRSLKLTGRAQTNDLKIDEL